MNWTEYFTALAHFVSQRSKDRNTKVGAVVVDDDNTIVSTGYNSFPRGINDDVPERQERPEKYFWFEHAERNAIFNAARIGVSTKGCTIYLSCGMPCAPCARAIINAGIKRVVISSEDKHLTGPDTERIKKWAQEKERAMQMFKEASVAVCYYQTAPIEKDGFTIEVS